MGRGPAPLAWSVGEEDLPTSVPGPAQVRVRRWRVTGAERATDPNGRAGEEEFALIVAAGDGPSSGRTAATGMTAPAVVVRRSQSRVRILRGPSVPTHCDIARGTRPGRLASPCSLCRGETVVTDIHVLVRLPARAGHGCGSARESHPVRHVNGFRLAPLERSPPKTRSRGRRPTETVQPIRGNPYRDPLTHP